MSKTDFTVRGPVTRDAPTGAGQLDLHYSIDQFFFDDEPDSRFFLRRIEEAVLATAGAPPRPNARALDVACGTGKLMARLAVEGWRASGVDASDEMLRLGQYISPEVLACDASLRSLAEVLPFRDASFGLVVCQGSMDHFAHPERFMAEAARVLAPGGRLVIALANYDSLSCVLGRNKASLQRRLDPSLPDDGFWKIPFDHTFKGTYLYLRRLNHLRLRRTRLLGVSLFQFLSPWRRLLGALAAERAGAVWRAADAAARRVPFLADALVAEWVKR